MTDALERTELLTTGPAEALAGLLGVSRPDFDGGEGLPLLWHWLYLLERPPQSSIGEDGHPVGGIPAPPGPGRRRMFAGGRVTQLGRLRIGAAATRRTWQASLTEKNGRSGRLTFAKIRSDISQNGEVLIAEEQDIVYREAAAAARGPLAPEPGAEHMPALGERWDVTVNPVLLFRFSALAYNAHRIHYDREYARDVEGYAGLVVHGPLQAVLMTELARHTGGPERCEFSYRLVSPLLEGQGMVVTAVNEGGESRVAVQDATGRRTASGVIRSHSE